ncbi:MAG: excinuclease ABC subunit C [Spirochaetes bacterium RBG_13_68_11]|nr:MAG: excinuclease ABC subunit C [Spirochaetes bacterium RBG_13_68_11]
MNALSDLANRDYPDRPGVYIWKDTENTPIYVGKARNLRNRLRSYFTGGKDIKTRFLLDRAADVELIVTATEYEALLLENNLIKRWRPKYNITLKDGKTYPVIRITADEFPRVFRTRRIVFDGSEYFGPYPKPQQIDTYLRLIEKYFPLRRCRGPLKGRTAPCLNYHMGRCSAPCARKIDREGYARIVEEVRALLSGRSRELVRDLKQKMKDASEALDFERAAVLRDQVAAIEEVSEGQSVERIEGGDRDYVAHVAAPAAGEGAAAADGAAAPGVPDGAATTGPEGATSIAAPPGGAILVVLQVRGGKLIGKEVFRIGEWGLEEESFSQFLADHYAGVRTFPEEVLVDFPVDEESLSAYLCELAGRPVAVRMPLRGRHTEMIALARENAREELARAVRSVEKDQALERLARDLGLEHPPRRIEGFDIAHLEGQDTVASLVSFLDGRPDRKQYRIFNMRSLHGRVDDFESIREAVARRYTKVLNEGLERPDLVLIDGGKGQLSAAVGVLEGLGLDAIPVAGLAKKKEEVYVPGREEPLAIDGDSPGLRILQAVRDESHRFATTRHKLKRGKRVSLSLLEGVHGIGAARSRRLMEAFGSLDKVLEATPEEIAAKAGMPRETAARLLVSLAGRRAAGSRPPVN